MINKVHFGALWSFYVFFQRTHVAEQLLAHIAAKSYFYLNNVKRTPNISDRKKTKGKKKQPTIKPSRIYLLSFDLELSWY